LFAGVALDGSALTIDHRSNELFYRRPGVLASEIIRSDAPAAPAPADNFIAAIERSAGGQSTSTAAKSSAPAVPAPEQTTPQQTESRTEDGLKTYPMEDPTPGDEPPM
jgi:hypothetical protein